VVTQADFATNVAGNGPAFSVYCSIAQSIPSSTPTKVQLDTKEFDPNSSFDASIINTNYWFKPVTAGYYQINWQVCYSIATASVRMYATLYKNGSPYKNGSEPTSSGSNNLAASGSSLVYMNGSTDYLQLYAFAAAASTLTTAGLISDSNYMNGFLARSA
jgi:hypothetical protein